MERDGQQADVDMVKRRLLNDAAVESFAFKSADEIYASESENLGEEIADILDTNPYSSEFEVFVKPAYASADSLTLLTAAYMENPGVDNTISESELVEGVENALSRSGIILGMLALVLLVVSIALINNTVSLSIYGRRFIIHTMKLVGATPGFIRRPFIIAALEGGLVAGAVAGALLVLARYYAAHVDAYVASLLPWETTAVVAVAVCLFGGLLCAVTAYFAAGKYLKSSYDEMFMK